jgi:hypothetical protein
MIQGLRKDLTKVQDSREDDFGNSENSVGSSSSFLYGNIFTNRFSRQNIFKIFSAKAFNSKILGVV